MCFLNSEKRPKKQAKPSSSTSFLLSSRLSDQISGINLANWSGRRKDLVKMLKKRVKLSSWKQVEKALNKNRFV